MAYDNFPLDTIGMKEEWEKRGMEQNAWLIFLIHLYRLAD